MKWGLDLSTRAKLFLSFVLMLLLQIVSNTLAYNNITAVRDAQKMLYDQAFTIAVAIKDIRTNQSGTRASLLALLLEPEGTRREVHEQDISNRQTENGETLRVLLDSLRDEPELRQLIEAFYAVRQEFVQTNDTQIIPLVRAGALAEAQDIVLGVQEERNQQLESLAGQLVDSAERRAQAFLAQSQESATASLRIFALVGLVAIVAGTWLALRLDRIIAHPLKRIAIAADRIADGDLTVSVPLEQRADEVGMLAQAFHKMVDSLREVNSELQNGVNVLASTASEILATTSQIAASATETATAVSETTTTVAEVKQTTEVARQKALYVSETAQKSAQVSQTGRQAVEETIDGMEQIRLQMETITESIVQLSEQSRAIGEIMATVNDLAEQANLLAVNAAIEAAKAGDYGKGFGVVAQEVKSLAEQSKQATTQVRMILNDIQKATNATVMATEQGSRAVEAGVKQSMNAGNAIRQLADSIMEAAQAATQITASGQQQALGIEQVGTAMENINVATTQNAAGTKQAEIAAQNLHQLGQNLQELVGRYRV